MPTYYLDSTWFTNNKIELNIGNVLVVYTDDGPRGICGQSMSVTAPHTYIFIYKDEKSFLDDSTKGKIGRQGKNWAIRHVVIGEYSNQGVFSLETI